jgi:hypothetical protein
MHETLPQANVSVDKAKAIIHKHLHYEEVSTSWVPKLLDQLRTNLIKFTRN